MFRACPARFPIFLSFGLSLLASTPRRAQGVSATTAAACLASSNIITVLEMVPYKLHSPDLQSAIYTINQQFNVQSAFTDKADPYATPMMGVAVGGNPRVGTNANPLPLPAGWPEPPLAVGAYATTPFREYNLFTMNFPTPNTISGATNWMEYQVTFNSPSDISATCLAAFTSFHFLNDPADPANAAVCAGKKVCYQGEWTAPA
jgi:hypothetical protein